MTASGQGEASEAARRIGAARRIVVKVGSSLVIGEGGAREAWMAGLAEDLAALIAAGKQVLLVTSGAVALGRPRLGLARSGRLEDKQAAAAAGQAVLMQAWDRAFAPHDVPTAQLLLTFGDTEQRRRWLNVRATLSVLLARRALPVINENDSVATDELRYGDNDRLSARVAHTRSRWSGSGHSTTSRNFRCGSRSNWPSRTAVVRAAVNRRRNTCPTPATVEPIVGRRRRWTSPGRVGRSPSNRTPIEAKDGSMWRCTSATTAARSNASKPRAIKLPAIDPADVPTSAAASPTRIR